MPEPEELLCFDNADAPYQIVMAYNSYCGPCAKAHRMVGKLYERFEDKLSVIVRFVNLNSDLSSRNELNVARSNSFYAVKDWYFFNDLKKYQKKVFY